MIATFTGVKPDLKHPDGRTAEIGIIDFTDCRGDNSTGVRLGIHRWLNLPKGQLIYEGSVAPLEDGKTEIQCLLAIVAAEFASLGVKREVLFIGNAAPRKPNTGNNRADPFVHTTINAGNTTIRYFGTVGEELGIAVRDQNLSAEEVWMLDMPVNQPFRSLHLYAAAGRALDGDSTVFLQQVDPDQMPAAPFGVRIAGFDRFDNVILDARLNEEPFNGKSWGSTISFKVGDLPQIHTATLVESFGSNGLVFLPGSAKMKANEPESDCIYLAVNHGHAAKMIETTKVGTVLHFLD